MLQAVLGILKILLWIILAILGLVLLVILLVLFSPIKYKVDAKYKEKAKINAKISFLIASIRIAFDQETKKLDYVVRLAGIKIKPGHRKSGKANKTKKMKTEKQIETDVVSEQVLEPDEDDNYIENQSLNESVLENVEQIDKIENEEIEEIEEIEEFDLFDDDLDKDVPKEQQSLIGRIKAFFSGLKNKLIWLKDKVNEFSLDKLEQSIETKLEGVRKTIGKFKRFWNLKCTVKTRSYLKKYLLGLIKHIGPRSIKGYVRYGFGDPCKTGQITGYMSVLPFVYQKNFSLIPDFYDKVIEADVIIKGRIRIGYIIRIVLNINIWRTILVARKIFRKKNVNVK